MKIAFCTPFKPVDHPRLSGDVTIARDLVRSLERLGHTVVPLPFYPAKELYAKPLKWPGAVSAMGGMAKAARGCDCWLTYGSYYKVPDLFGPTVAPKLGLPYFLLQASYAPKRAQRLKTWPGYRLNKRAMLAADQVFCNRVNDLQWCVTLLPGCRFEHIRPGLPGGLFRRDASARERLRREWQAGKKVVISTAAMMRHGVKAMGLRWVIDACGSLADRGRDLLLTVAGDGPRRPELEGLAVKRLGNRVHFLGQVDRSDLAGVFSASDVFAFPGLAESIGMVYLEAQACGVPVVATSDEGAPHVVAHETSGLITPVTPEAFTNALDWLVTDHEYRRTLGMQAAAYVAARHDAATNYATMASIMEHIVQQRKSA